MSVPGSRSQQQKLQFEAAPAPELRLNWELPAWLPDFIGNIRSALGRKQETVAISFRPGIFWKDVFVDQRLNWKNIARSYAGHIVFAGLVYVLSMPFYWQRLTAIETFHHDRLVYLNPDEDVLVAEPIKAEPSPRSLTPVISRSSRASVASAEDARRRMATAISIAKWADNSTRTIVDPAAPKIQARAPMPDIVLTSRVPQAPPVASVASSAPKLFAPPPEITPVAPAPELAQTRSQLAAVPEAAPIAPPVEIKRTRNLASLDISPVPQPVNAEPKLTIEATHASLAMPAPAPIAPAPDVSKIASADPAKTLLAPAQPVAPPPDTSSVTDTHILAGNLPVTAEPVAPPPDLSGAGNAPVASGTLLSLNVSPVAAPLRQPDGNSRGAFAARPDARISAPGSPARLAGGTGAGGDSPAATPDELGIIAAAVPHGTAAGSTAITTQALRGGASANGKALFAMPPPRIVLPPPSAAKVVDHPNALDERVFHGRKYYTMALNTPNLNSAGGSWIFRFAERGATSQKGDVTAPIAVREVDPAYPADMIHDNIQGVVVLYAIIRADGTVAEVKVLEGFDDRLDENARKALSSWQFVPGTRDGNPVDLEAVVRIPFRSKRTF